MAAAEGLLAGPAPRAKRRSAAPSGPVGCSTIALPDSHLSPAIWLATRAAAVPRACGAAGAAAAPPGAVGAAGGEGTARGWGRMTRAALMEMMSGGEGAHSAVSRGSSLEQRGAGEL